MIIVFWITRYIDVRIEFGGTGELQITDDGTDI
jgi:hypothetical protein